MSYLECIIVVTKLPVAARVRGLVKIFPSRNKGWRGRWEGVGSGWGIHEYPWLIHVNV